LSIIKIDIDTNKLVNDLKAKLLLSPMQNLPEILTNLVIGQFKQKFDYLVNSGEIIRYKIKNNYEKGSPDSHVNTNKWPIRHNEIQLPWYLHNLPKGKIINLGWYEFEIVTKNEEGASISFEGPKELTYNNPIEIRQKFTKKRCKYIVRIGWKETFGLHSDILKSLEKDFGNSCECPKDSLAAYIDGVWDWTIRFICKICGKSYYCECFKPALEKYYLKAKELENNYSQGWPQKFINEYKKYDFKENICHICRDITSEIQYCHPMYGSNVKVHYGPYIKKISIEKEVDEREAENEVRDILGIPHIGEGWISEKELLNIIKGIFPTKEIIHQASPEWLGRQRIDIYVPELKLAIEYQGLQHYEPVEYFGGEEGFRKNKERDELKARLCSQNGIKMVYFRYNEEIKKDVVEIRLKQKLEERWLNN